MKQCNHKKVYSDVVLYSNPPIYQWICCLCGLKGTSPKMTVLNIKPYQEVEEMFKDK